MLSYVKMDLVKEILTAPTKDEAVSKKAELEVRTTLETSEED